MPSSAQACSIRVRSSELAATPPARQSARAPTAAAAARARVTSTSTTASWNEAATSAVDASGSLRTRLTTEVFNPLNEKSKPSPGSERGNA